MQNNITTAALSPFIAQVAATTSAWVHPDSTASTDPGWKLAFDAADTDQAKKNIVAAWWWCATAEIKEADLDSQEEVHKYKTAFYVRHHRWLNETEQYRKPDKAVHSTIDLQILLHPSRDKPDNEEVEAYEILLSRMLAGQSHDRLAALLKLPAFYAFKGTLWESLVVVLAWEIAGLPDATQEHQHAAAKLSVGAGLAGIAINDAVPEVGQNWQWIGCCYIGTLTPATRKSRMLAAITALKNAPAVLVAPVLEKLVQHNASHNSTMERFKSRAGLFLNRVTTQPMPVYDLCQLLAPNYATAWQACAALDLPLEEAVVFVSRHEVENALLPVALPELLQDACGMLQQLHL